MHLNNKKYTSHQHKTAPLNLTRVRVRYIRKEQIQTDKNHIDKVGKKAKKAY